MLPRITKYASIFFLIFFTFLLLSKINSWGLLYGIEPERIEPHIPSNLPKVNLTPNAQNFLLLPKSENNSFALHLSLPYEYIAPDKKSDQLSASYDISPKMYYPDMTGSFNPLNAALKKCDGHCGGRISTLIEAVDPNNKYLQNKLTSIYEDKNGKRQNKIYKPLEKIYGFDEHLMFTYPKLSPYSTEEIFIKKNQDGSAKYIFKCLPNTPSPGCTADYIPLPNYPEIYTHISFGMHLLPEWDDLITKMNNRMTQWVTKKYVLHNDAK